MEKLYTQPHNLPTNQTTTAQVAMYNRNFSESTPASDLPCMNCLRVEMGERACYTGHTVKVPHFAVVSQCSEMANLNLNNCLRIYKDTC